MTIHRFDFEVNLGTLSFTWNEQEQIRSIRWVHIEQNLCQSFLLASESVPRPVMAMVEQFRRYFDKGEPLKDSFWDLVDQNDLTPFQREVYQSTALVPHGETRTYAWVAAKMLRFKATRAVGQALRLNPFAILVPCHRVVSSQGDLGGFMGKKNPEGRELVLKRKLLEHEDQYRNPIFPFLNSSLNFFPMKPALPV